MGDYAIIKVMMVSYIGLLSLKMEKCVGQGRLSTFDRVVDVYAGIYYEISGDYTVAVESVNLNTQLV